MYGIIEHDVFNDDHLDINRRTNPPLKLNRVDINGALNEYANNLRNEIHLNPLIENNYLCHKMTNGI